MIEREGSDIGPSGEESSTADDRSSKQVGSVPVPESPKTTIRWDEGLKADAERCAKERGIPVAEFVRQAIAHYVSWCAAQKERANQPDE